MLLSSNLTILMWANFDIYIACYFYLIIIRYKVLNQFVWLSCVLFLPQELGTDVNLYALVFGESVLNDAVWVFCLILDFLIQLFLPLLIDCMWVWFFFWETNKMAISLYRFVPFLAHVIIQYKVEMCYLSLILMPKYEFSSSGQCRQ